MVWILEKCQLPVCSGKIETMTWSTHVFPMPISSASIPPFHTPASCAFIQYRLSFWKGKSLSLREG